MSDRALATSILFDQCPGGDTAGGAAGAGRGAAADGPVLSVQRGLALLGPGASWAAPTLFCATSARAGPRCVPCRKQYAAGSRGRRSPIRCRNGATARLPRCSCCTRTLSACARLRPASRRLQLRPQLGDLPDLETVSYTPRGPVEFKARRVGATHHISVTLPPDCEAELLLPAGIDVPFAPLSPDAAPGLRRYRLPAGGSSFAIPVKAS